MAAVITSITGLQNLPNLQNFNADYNSLTTVNLSGLANLLFVDISDNDVLDGSGDPSLTSVNLSGCTALQTLRLDDSDFSAGIPNLAGLTSLTNLDMDQCSISGVVDLTGLSALEELDFYGNTALTSIIIDDAQPIQYFYASSCALTETAVDNILIELSDNGIAGGNVELDGGTNAIPSATGLAAKSALEADGWTVDINEPTTTTTTSSSTSTTTSTSTSTTTIAPTTTTTTTTAALTPFLMTVDIVNPGTAVTLPYGDIATYTGTIDWGDTTITANSFATKEHTYAAAGIYQITVDGTVGFWNAGYYGAPMDQLVSIDQFGNQFSFGNNDGTYFAELPSLVTIASDIPLTGIINMHGMFYNAIVFNSDISGWNVSSVTNMSAMFENAQAFNQNIGGWDVSNVSNMNKMFESAYAFNQDISGWDVSSVTTMNDTFHSAQAFNQNIGSWNVSNVYDMGSMFNGAYAFNQDISGWDVSSVTTMRNMFFAALAFNQSIGSWNVSNVVDMNSMFEIAQAFNQDIGGWNVSNVYDLSGFLTDATAFSSSNLGNIYVGWNALPTLYSGVIFDAPTICYPSSASVDRNNIVSLYSWTINDGGVCPEPTTTTTTTAP